MKNTRNTAVLAASLIVASFGTRAQTALGDVLVNGNAITLTTAGPGEGPLSGTDALWIDALEGGLAVPGYSLGSDAFEGSAFTKTWAATAGSTLSFNWTLTTDAFDAGYADRAFAVINGSVFTVASVAAGTVAGTFSHTFASGGLYTVSLGVVDVNDATGNSRWDVSNIHVTAVPEPDTYALLLAGLGLMGTVVRRRTGA